MKLIELQKLFQKAVLEGDTSSDRELCQYIKAAADLTPDRGLAVYKGSIIGQFSQTLSSIYPVCCRLVGEKFFDAVAVNYIDRFPSLSPDLGDYGEQFPDFLANFEPVGKLPYLPDVARLEWYWHRIFNGEDAAGLDFKALSEIPQEKWGEVIFQLPKNSILLESVYPIHRIWQVNQPEYEGDDRVSLDEGGIKIFLWRQGYDIRIDLPNDSEWQLLKSFQAKNSFESVCENLAAKEPPIDVASLLPLFVQRGWVAGFSIC